MLYLMRGIGSNVIDSVDQRIIIILSIRDQGHDVIYVYNVYQILYWQNSAVLNCPSNSVDINKLCAFVVLDVA